ncbi:MAG: hypothetical protein JSR58_01365 [Verrucomicrobia bacterium]|nr:hypothetical protein [Verrucomicrobiota bacterium]
MQIDEIPIGKFGFIKEQTIQWLKNHQYLFAAGCGALVILLFAAGRFLGWFQGGGAADFVSVDATYRKWDGGKETLSKLEKILRRHPELHVKYDGAIAQKLLSSSQSGLAQAYAHAAIKRMGTFSPYYTDFSSASLLIAGGKLEDALAAAKKLKIQMENDEAFWQKRSPIVSHGSILYAYNLVRIAALEKVAGSPEGELTAWHELKKNAGWDLAAPSTKASDAEAYLLVAQNFQLKDVTLRDYIRHREAVLTSSKHSLPSDSSPGLQTSLPTEK